MRSATSGESIFVRLRGTFGCVSLLAVATICTILLVLPLKTDAHGAEPSTTCKAAYRCAKRIFNHAVLNDVEKQSALYDIEMRRKAEYQLKAQQERMRQTGQGQSSGGDVTWDVSVMTQKQYIERDIIPPPETIKDPALSRLAFYFERVYYPTCKKVMGHLSEWCTVEYARQQLGIVGLNVTRCTNLVAENYDNACDALYKSFFVARMIKCLSRNLERCSAEKTGGPTLSQLKDDRARRRALDSLACPIFKCVGVNIVENCENPEKTINILESGALDPILLQKIVSRNRLTTTPPSTMSTTSTKSPKSDDPLPKIIGPLDKYGGECEYLETVIAAARKTWKLRDHSAARNPHQTSTATTLFASFTALCVSYVTFY